MCCNQLICLPKFKDNHCFKKQKTNSEDYQVLKKEPLQFRHFFSYFGVSTKRLMLLNIACIATLLTFNAFLFKKSEHLFSRKSQ